MQSFRNNTLLDFYKEAVNCLLYDPPQVRSPRGQPVHEIIGAHIEITDPNECMWNNDANTRPYPIDYLKDELCAYLSCTDDLDTFKKISAFWGKLSDDRATINSAYGKIVYSDTRTNKVFDQVEPHLDTSNQLFMAWNKEVFTQFDWVMNAFENDKDTRQAIMFVASPYYQYEGNKDFICTLNYHFIIDDNNRLNMIVNRRSQDIHFGMTFDVPWEVILMKIILFEVQKLYPDVTLGSYFLNCNSLHMYERNFEEYRSFSDDETLRSIRIPNVSGNYFKDYDVLTFMSCASEKYTGDDKFKIWLTEREQQCT